MSSEVVSNYNCLTLIVGSRTLLNDKSFSPGQSESAVEPCRAAVGVRGGGGCSGLEVEHNCRQN